MCRAARPCSTGFDGLWGSKHCFTLSMCTLQWQVSPLLALRVMLCTEGSACPQAVTAVHLSGTAYILGKQCSMQALSNLLLYPGTHCHLITGHPAVSHPSEASGPAEPYTSCPAGNAVFFTTYEALRRSFPGRRQPQRQDSTLLSVLADSASAITCGGIAGTVMWAVGVFAAQQTASLPCWLLLQDYAST